MKTLSSRSRNPLTIKSYPGNLSCPYCENKMAFDTKEHHIKTVDGMIITKYKMVCNMCGASGPMSTSYLKAVRSWMTPNLKEEAGRCIFCNLDLTMLINNDHLYMSCCNEDCGATTKIIHISGMVKIASNKEIALLCRPLTSRAA
jgi:hypothetical protein